MSSMHWEAKYCNEQASFFQLTVQLPQITPDNTEKHHVHVNESL